MDMSESNPKVKLSWKSLYCSATSGILTRKTTRILNNLTGSVSSGEMIALLGSSGSGKTVLLQCLAGLRVTGVTGDITMTSCSDQKIRISSVPQTAELYANLTVRESVLFSSQIRCQERSKNQHLHRVDDLLTSLKLLPAANTPVTRCSGGQQKRVTLAIEMISDPNIMLLDEVTSGLDSRICYDLLNLVKQIAQEKNIAVIISIHQPTWPSSLIFDRILMLANGGRTFYYDEPSAMESFLTAIHVSVPNEQNPADILMEASCGCFGTDVFANGVAITSASLNNESSSNDVTPDDVKMYQVKKSNKSHNNFTTFYILFLRMLLVFIRNVPLVSMMFLSYGLSVPLDYLMFEDSGNSDPCPIRTINENISLPTVLTDEITKSADVFTNLQAFAAFANAGSVLGGTLLLITIPKLIQLSTMELANNWFHPLILYIVSAVFDAFIFTLTYPVINAFPFYYWLQQNTEFDRTMLAMNPVMIDAFQAQAMVALIASCLSDYITSSIAVLLNLTIVFLASSPIMVKFSVLPDAQVYYSYLSHQRHALDMVIISQYGDDVCGDQDALMANAQTTRDYVMNFVQTIRAQVVDVIQKADHANGNYRFSSMSQSGMDETSMNAITETISNTLISPYMSKAGRIESLPFVYGDYEEDDYWKAMGFLVTMMVATRIIAGIVFVRKVQKQSKF